jgi:hypothetical protein
MPWPVRVRSAAMERATSPATEAAIEQARRLFLDRRNVYGCAETTFIVLKTAYGLEDADDSSAAMALNGGVAYGGGPCGAISGPPGVGLLAGRVATTGPRSGSPAGAG